MFDIHFRSSILKVFDIGFKGVGKDCEENYNLFLTCMLKVV
ncbi:hypothetical protein CU013_2280 [Enterococcus faecium]|nr:hypothetical protein [Enterococcus faecium]MBK4835937.1 hypothetical protein [Enterococcus faecium]